MSSSSMLTLDGAQGEGGGQILRTALALSLVTGQAFRLERIRAGRKKPGLSAQHLAAVRAAISVGQADATGDQLGSQTLEFRPTAVQAGDYRFTVGTAGSATLVLQTVLPPLLLASAPSALSLEGGTHNPFAPPFEFVARSWAPLIRRMGPELDLQLDRPGFFPAGGGRFHARIQPVKELRRLDLFERGEFRTRRAWAIVARIPDAVGEREMAVVRTELGWSEEECRVEKVANPMGPGNAVLLEIEADAVVGVFSAFGERGRAAEAVARDAVAAASAWLHAEAPVDEHLADQLLVPMALAGSGSFRTVKPSPHFTTNADIIQSFLPVSIRWEQEGQSSVWQVRILG